MNACNDSIVAGEHIVREKLTAMSGFVWANTKPEFQASPLPATINRPVKRLKLVARLSPAFYIGPHAGWNYGIVTRFLTFYNSKFGGRI